MERKKFEEAVCASGLNTNARFIALRYASYQQYSGDGVKGVWPSQQTIASETAISEETVGKYVNALIEDGWLVVIGMTGAPGGPQRVKVVRLEVGRAENHLLITRRKGQPRDVMVKPSIPYPLEPPSPNHQDHLPLTVRTPSSNHQELTTIITTNTEQSLEQPYGRVADAPGSPENFSVGEIPSESFSGVIPTEPAGLVADAPFPSRSSDVYTASVGQLNIVSDSLANKEAAAGSLPAPPFCTEGRAREALVWYLKPGIPYKDLTAEEQARAVARICDGWWNRMIKDISERAAIALNEQVTLRDTDW